MCKIFSRFSTNKSFIKRCIMRNHHIISQELKKFRKYVFDVWFINDHLVRNSGQTWNLRRNRTTRIDEHFKLTNNFLTIVSHCCYFGNTVSVPRHSRCFKINNHIVLILWISLFFIFGTHCIDSLDETITTYYSANNFILL